MKLYLSLLLGIFVHMLMSAQASVRSSSNGLKDSGIGLAGMWTWFRLNVVSIFIRVVIQSAIFGYVHAHPEILADHQVYGVSVTLAWYWMILGGIGLDAFFDSGIFVVVKLLQDKVPALKGVSIDVPAFVPPPQAGDPPTGPAGTH